MVVKKKGTRRVNWRSPSGPSYTEIAESNIYSARRIVAASIFKYDISFVNKASDIISTHTTKFNVCRASRPKVAYSQIQVFRPFGWRPCRSPFLPVPLFSQSMYPSKSLGKAVRLLLPESHSETHFEKIRTTCRLHTWAINNFQPFTGRSGCADAWKSKTMAPFPWVGTSNYHLWIFSSQILRQTSVSASCLWSW